MPAADAMSTEIQRNAVWRGRRRSAERHRHPPDVRRVGAAAVSAAAILVDAPSGIDKARVCQHLQPRTGTGLGGMAGMAC